MIKGVKKISGVEGEGERPREERQGERKEREGEREGERRGKERRREIELEIDYTAIVCKPSHKCR